MYYLCFWMPYEVTITVRKCVDNIGYFGLGQAWEQKYGSLFDLVVTCSTRSQPSPTSTTSISLRRSSFHAKDKECQYIRLLTYACDLELGRFLRVPTYVGLCLLQQYPLAKILAFATTPCRNVPHPSSCFFSCLPSRRACIRKGRRRRRFLQFAKRKGLHINERRANFVHERPKSEVTRREIRKTLYRTRSPGQWHLSDRSYLLIWRERKAWAYHEPHDAIFRVLDDQGRMAARRETIGGIPGYDEDLVR